MQIEFSIIYTSDTHGKLSSYDFMSKSYGSFGLSRLSSYLKTIKTNFILLDNGDFLQGSPLLDFARKNNLQNPAALMFNTLNYDYITVGNHDFNYGLNYLESFKNSFNQDILCANIYKDKKPYFRPYAIHVIDDVKIAIIGLTTEYIPVWERRENILDLQFLDVVDVTKKVINDNQLKEKADLIVLLYHGGYEKNPTSGEMYRNPTVENRGNQLININDVDIVLTGHQHVPQIHQKGLKVTMQTSHNAQDFGVLRIIMEKNDQGQTQLIDVKPEILKMNKYPIDFKQEKLISDLIKKTNKYLSEVIGSTVTDMMIKTPLEARIKKHPLFQLINQVQMEYTKAEISCASLPNETHGFPYKISFNDIAVNFPFENDMVVLEITGQTLLDALEQNASYFDLDRNEVVINSRFLFPKVEHYNYDVYDGITYEMHIKKPIGQRIKNVYVKDVQLDLKQAYRLVLNSYRATGAGGFDMFKEAKIIKSYPVSYFELVSEFIMKNKVIKIDVINNFKLVKI